MAAFGFQQSLRLCPKEIYQVEFQNNFLPVKPDFTNLYASIFIQFESYYFVPACETLQPAHAPLRWSCSNHPSQKERWYFKSALESCLQKTAKLEGEDCS